MFEIGDLIVYGNTGVCRVVKIGQPAISGVREDKDYYTLAPYYSEKSLILTPCDNEKVVMRPILSRDEAEQLLNEIAGIGLIEIIEEKKREECYKENLRSCDPYKFVSMMRTIYERKKQRMAEGKKVTSSDEKYYQMVEEKLYGELSIVLEKEKTELKEFILNVFAEVK